MFGHVKGAFTGADSHKIGLTEAAHGGDLFLDEIEAMPLSFQVKLLRFFESGEIRRVGAKEPTRVHVRTIVASNRPLQEMIKKGEFREDLYYRLSSQKIVIPPLRERRDDIPALANHFLETERPYRNKSFESEAMDVLKAYGWPGNVRELKRIIEQLCLTSPLPIIRVADIANLLEIKARSGRNPPDSLTDSYNLADGLESVMRVFEKKMIETSPSIGPPVAPASNRLRRRRLGLTQRQWQLVQRRRLIPQCQRRRSAPDRQHRRLTAGTYGRGAWQATLPPICNADINGDGVLDYFDYLDFVAAFSANTPIADYNLDAVIDFFDYLDFVADFSTGC